MNLKTTTLLLVTLSLSVTALADDWTQWAGNDRLCNWNETGILKTFPKEGLKPVWSVPVGSGYSGPVVWQGRVFVTDYRPKPEPKLLEAIERVLCLDEKTGKQLWSHEWETHYRRQLHSYATGPRATPLVSDGRLYTLGATGMVHCLDAKTGKVQWEYDALEAFDAEVPAFGVSASPLAWKDTVIFVCGGSEGLLRAVDKVTGKQIWKVRQEEPFASELACTACPIVADGKLIVHGARSVQALDLSNGKQIWVAKCATTATSTPILAGKEVIVFETNRDSSGALQTTKRMNKNVL